MHSTEASNFPLRGQKVSVWEGGCRVPACIYSPLFKNNQRVSDDFMFITDVLPTMAHAAGIKINTELDGVSQWETINEKSPTPRKEILYNIESVFGFSGIMNEGWKLVNGTENIQYSDWFGSSGEEVNLTFDDYLQSVLNSTAALNLPKLSIEQIKNLREKSTTKCENSTNVKHCNPLKSPCLFNILNDPCERNNLADEFPDKVQFLLSRISHHIVEMVPSIRKPPDLRCDPKFHNFTWTWWLEEKEIKNDQRQVSIFIILIIIVAFIIFFITKSCSKKQKKDYLKCEISLHK